MAELLKKARKLSMRSKIRLAVENLKKMSMQEKIQLMVKAGLMTQEEADRAKERVSQTATNT